MSKKDFYEVLGVGKSAGHDEIKSAYKKLAMKHHPDRNQDKKEECEEKLKEINEAYETLKDEEKRANYDRFGHSTQGGGFGGRSGGSSGGFGGFEDIFEDINSMFGGGFGSSSRRRSSQSSSVHKGSDLRYTLKINLKESYLGARKNITFKALGQCPDCNGKGGEGVITCPECNGSGTVRYQQGFFLIENTCSKCNGEGRLIKNPCKKCKGSGRYEKQYEVEVAIPRGAKDGEMIKMPGKGEAGLRGGTFGDLFVVIKVENNEFFTRQNDDLYCEVHIKFTTAILGGVVKIPLINGTTEEVKIGEGAQNGEKIRISGKGMPKNGSSVSSGDMYVMIKIETPVSLTSEQRKLIEELDRTLVDSSHPRHKSFLNRIIGIFS